MRMWHTARSHLMLFLLVVALYGFKRAYSEKQARYETDATLWHTRRRCGGGVNAPTISLHSAWIRRGEGLPGSWAVLCFVARLVYRPGPLATAPAARQGWSALHYS